MSDTAKEKVLEGLRKAMEAEAHGHHFYRMAAINAEDPKGKETFDQLSKEEMDHLEFLRKHYKSMVETGRLDPSAKLTKIAHLEGPSPIFSDSIKSRIGQAHVEMTALSIGIQLELNAINYYKQQGEASDDPEVRQFFLDLSEWEKGHYHALLRQQEELKEDYWTQGGFAPF